MSHDSHDRWSFDGFVAERVSFAGRTAGDFLLFKCHVFKAEFFYDDGRGLEIDLLIDRRHDTVLEQLTDKSGDG